MRKLRRISNRPAPLTVFVYLRDVFLRTVRKDFSRLFFKLTAVFGICTSRCHLNEETSLKKLLLEKIDHLFVNYVSP